MKYLHPMGYKNEHFTFEGLAKMCKPTIMIHLVLFLTMCIDPERS